MKQPEVHVESTPTRDQIHVKMSEGEQVAAQRTQQPKQGEHNEERSFEPRPKNTTKLQIKALPYGTTKDDLTDLCRRYGQITAIEAKGTQGFVTFFKPDEAQLAIHKLDGIKHEKLIPSPFFVLKF